jgi:hypothetical protein
MQDNANTANQRFTRPRTLKQTKINHNTLQPGRTSSRRESEEPHTLEKSFGDPIQNKQPATVRILFQNVKGLTYSNLGRLRVLSELSARATN